MNRSFLSQVSKNLVRILLFSLVAFIPSAEQELAQATPTTSICFNGSQYLSGDITNLPKNMDAYTIEAWIQTSVGTGKLGIAGWGAASGGNTNAFTTINTGLYNWWYGNDLSGSSSQTSIADGNWHHVVAEFDGTTRSLYQDGTLIASGATSGHTVTITSSFKVGGYNGEMMNGCISNLRIVKGIAVYSGSSFTVPTSSLTATQAAGTNIASIPAGATVLLLNNTTNILQDNSSYGYLLTNNGSATPSSSGPSISYPTVTSTVVTDSITARSYGSTETLTATISAGGAGATSATGTIRFANSGTTISGCSAVTVVSGVATCPFTIPAGDISLTATYSGDSSYSGSSSSAVTFSIPYVASDPSHICSLTVSGTNFTNFLLTKSDIYCVAAFKDTGSYTVTVPASANSIDYVLVGGGGGGASGGGGAGGLLQGSNYSVTPNSTVTVTVGAGGAGGNGGSAQTGVAGSQGGNSTFGTLTAIGGGGGNSGGRTVATGGSGGGSSYDCTGSGGSCGAAGKGTVGQGNNGGFSTYNSYGAGAGGGGAGGAGYNTTRNYIGGNGGIGATSTLINALAAATGTGVLSGGNYYFAGGGGGGINDNTNQYVGLNSSSSLIYGGNSGAVAAGTVYTNGGGQGGIGGGGRGSSFGRSGGTPGQYANPTAGAANTGGGGGGVDPEDINAASGGSGVVLIRWVAPTSLKTITFNSNTSPVQTSSQVVVTGTSTPLNANSFSRTGYIFSGWTASADGTGATYADSSSISISADTTLYAKWITGVNKTVTFNGNSSTSGSMASQAAGTPTALNSNSFRRTSYTFTGWNTAANGSGYSYADNAVYAFNADVTLYAQWVLTRTPYTVTFYANAVDVAGTTPSQTADTTTPLTLNGYTRPNMNFLGWNTSYNAGTATYLDGQNYAFTSDMNLYAIWVAQASTNVVFNGNTSTSGSTASQTASSSTTLNANGFVKDGYTFIKWNTAADGSGVSYNSGYTYSFAAGLTLYAIWSKNLAITYSGNGATSGTIPSSQSYYAGGPKVTVSNNAGNLQRTGYSIIGWNSAADGSGTAYSLGGANSTFVADTTLYAQWAGSTFAILYTANSASSGSAPASQTYTYGSAGISLRSNSGSLARTGFNFNGWNSQPDGSGIAYAETATAVTFSADTVLFAQWTPITYTVTYDANSGVVASPSASFTYGGSITLPTPTKTGYSFSGWYDTSTAGSRIADGGAVYNTAQSRTLYAQWSLNTYLYTFNPMGGTVDSATVSYDFGSPALVLRTPTRTSYQFNGWYSASTGGTRIGGAGDTDIPTSSKTLFAQWTQLSLAGMGSSTKIGTITTSAGNANSFSVSNSGTRVQLDYLANSLPDSTTIDAYLLADTSHAAGIIADSSNLLLSLVVAWKAPDGTVPSTATGSPLSMTITNSGIKSGAKIYSLIGNVSTLIGTATSDGFVTVSFSDDPEIVIQNPAVAPAASGGGGGGGGGSPAPVAPVAPVTPVAPVVPVVPVAPVTPVAPVGPVVPVVPVTPVAPVGPAKSASQTFTPIPPSVPTVPTGTAQSVSVIQNGVPVQGFSTAVSASSELVLSASDWNLQISGLSSSGSPLTSDTSNNLVVQAGSSTVTQGSGFAASSPVTVYAFSTHILLGTFTTDANGLLQAKFTIPKTLSAGQHMLQINGYGADGSTRSVTVGMIVSAPMTTMNPTVSSTGVTKGLALGGLILFASGSSTINPAAQAALKALSAKINKLKSTRVLSLGTPDGKTGALSKARALAVAHYLMLVCKGSRFSVHWYGVSTPPHSLNTSTSGSGNQGVEVWIH